MLKKIGFATLVVALSSSVALAADPFDWTGWYVYTQGGNANADLMLEATATSPSADLPLPFSPSGGLPGAGVEFDYQIEHFVFGFDLSGLSGTTSEYTKLANQTEYTVYISDIYTSGIKLGAAFENWLFYGEAGLASAELDMTEFTDGELYEFDEQRAKGTYYGFGVEYAINEYWILGTEYNHIELEDKILTGHYKAKTRTRNLKDTEIDTLVAKLIFKF